jgi:hypothetical protein
MMKNRIFIYATVLVALSIVGLTGFVVSHSPVHDQATELPGYADLAMQEISRRPELSKFNQFGYLAGFSVFTHRHQECDVKMFAIDRRLFGERCRHGDSVDWVSVHFDYRYSDIGSARPEYIHAEDYLFHLVRKSLFLKSRTELSMYFDRNQRLVYAAERRER